MTKNKLLYTLGKNEDSILTVRLTKKESDFLLEKEKKSGVENPKRIHKLDICCTTNFNNDYIRSLKKRKFNTNGGVLVFSWTENKFRILDPSMVSDIKPLSSILKNVSPKIIPFDAYAR